MFFKRALLLFLFVAIIGCAGSKLYEDRYVASGEQKMRAVIQLAHSSAVNSVAFSHDGRLALSGSSDSTLKIWEISTGREIRTLRGHSSSVNAVCFSPDGSLALSGSANGRIMLWETTTGLRLKNRKAHSSQVDDVAFTLDGKSALALSANEGLKIYKVSGGDQVRIYPISGHNPGGFGPGRRGPVAITPDGRYALSGTYGNSLKLWDISPGARTIQRFKGAKGHGLYNPSVYAAAVSRDGRFVLMRRESKRRGFSYSVDELWEIASGKRIHAFQGFSGGRTLTISPDFRFALTVRKKGRFDAERESALILEEIYSAGKILKSRIIRVLGKLSQQALCAAISNDSRFILTGHHSGILILWDVSTGRPIRTFKGRSPKISSVAYSPDGSFALCGSSDSTLELWNTSTGQNMRTFQGHSDNVTSVAFSPDGHYAVSGSDDKTVRLWNAITGHEVRTFRGHSDSIASVAFSPDGFYVLSGAKDETLKLWDVATRGEIRTFKGHTHWVTSVAFSPDGRHILSGAKDDVVKLWDVTSGANIRDFEGQSGDVDAVDISPDGRFLLSGGWRSLKLWEVSTGNEIRTFKGQLGNVAAVTFSPDGHYAVSGGDDNAVRLWNLSKNREVMKFRGHLDAVTSVAFSSDGQLVMSGSKDMTTRIWDIQNGTEVVKFMSSRDGEWIIVTPDGYYNTSPEGASLLHWVYSGGLETFTFEQFESRFKRPDIIKARLAGNFDAGVPAPAMTRPPHIEMADHLSIKETSARNYSLALTASALQEVKTVRVFVNGKPTLEVPVNVKEKELSLDVPLLSGANRITAVAYDEKGFSSNPKYLDVTCKHAGLAKPNLYIFAIGISKYPRLSSKWQLEFAHTDAQALIKALKSQEGKLFGEVRYNLLSNEKATVQTINDVLDALSSMDENDLAVIFMAGHGVKAQDGTFYFLTSDGSFEEPQRGGLSWAAVGKYLSRVKGRVILLLDACHSGSIVTETVVPNDELAQQFFTGGRGGVMVFSASKGRQYSLESPDIGGGFGIFTYALTQSLGSRAKDVDTNNNGFVEFTELVDSVSTYVDKETKGEQTPWLSRKELFGDLPVAIVN
jgi:WD40 repeat protein